MNIIGEKVILRAIEKNDRDMLLGIVNSGATERMLGGFSFPVSSDEQEHWIESQHGNRDILRCVIAPKQNPQNGIGTVILSDLDYINGTAQIHIKMMEGDVRHKGYGSDAVSTITEYAFKELRLNCVYSDVLSYNTNSQRLFEKCGYKKDGVLRSRIFKNGQYVDVISFSIIKSDGVANV